MDCKSAFLHSKLPESDNFWIRLPTVPGVPSAKGRIVNLFKYLYGLRQAPKILYPNLPTTLAKVVCRGGQSNDCLYVSSIGHLSVYIVAYIEDLLVIGEITAFSALRRNWEIY